MKYTSSRRCYDIVCVELLKAKDLNIKHVNDDGDTLLSLLVKNNKSYCLIKGALKAGANPNIPLENGDSLLIYAVKNCGCRISKLLIKYGADVDYTNPDRDSAFSLVLQKRYHTYELAELIRSKTKYSI